MYNLNVPKSNYSSYSQVAGNSNGALPQFLSAGNRHRSSKSNSSLIRLSRTNTNTTDYPPTNASDDSKSINEKIQTARPAITHADKLWTKIDVLDDVKNMSDEVKVKGSFFNDAFNEELAKLKESQNKLLEQMSIYHAKIREEETFKSANIEAIQADIEVDEEDNETSGVTNKVDANTMKDNFCKVEMDKFFKPDRNILHRKQDLQELEEYIENVRNQLEVVGVAMKKFDDRTRNLW